MAAADCALFQNQFSRHKRVIRGRCLPKTQAIEKSVEPIKVNNVLEKMRRPVETEKVKKAADSELEKKIVGKKPVENELPMVRCNKAEIKKTEKVISPYIRRAVVINEKLTDVERKLGFWVMHNKENEMGDIVFYNGAYELRMSS